MPVSEATPELDALLKGADTLARIPLGREAAACLEAPGGRVDIVAVKTGDGADYAAVIHGSGLFARELLGRGDDLAEVLRHASSMADGRTPAVVELSRRALGLLSPPAEPHELTEEQVAVAKQYADGDFAWLVDHAREHGVASYDKELGRLGDNLFAYVMRELDPRENCDSRGEAIERLAAMRGDLETAEDAVIALDTAPAP